MIKKFKMHEKNETHIPYKNSLQGFSESTTWVLSARGWSQECNESLGRASTALEGPSPTSPFCMLSSGKRHTFSLSLSSFDLNACVETFGITAVDRERTALPLCTVSHPSASFRSVQLKEENNKYFFI